MNDDSELFEPESTPAPKRKTRTRRAAVVVAEAVAELPAETEPPATFDDLRAAGERFVRERPFAALALAVGMGYLIGRFKR